VTCIDDERLAAWIGSQISESERELAILHADGCARCREVIAELVGVGGETILSGRYRIDGPLASGGMGVVQRATDLVLDRAVAIKMIRASLDAPEYRQHFLREAQAMAQLAHPNVVAVHDFGEIGDEVFIVMELLEGHTLQRWAAGHSRREVIAAMLGVGRGLAAIHERGLVHRDIKPDNIIVRDDGTAVIVDFGLAHTESITIVGGTPRYIAPEVRAGRAASAKSDQYAWWRVVEACLEAPPRVVRRGLDANPARRFATTSDAIAALERATRPRRWRFAVVAVIALAVIAAIPGSRSVDPCSVVEALPAVQRVQIAAGLQAAGASERALASIDARVEAIRRTRPAACRASFNPMTRAVGLRTEMCLDDTWHRTTWVLASLGSPHRELVWRALDSLATLPPTDGCVAQRTSGAIPRPPDPSQLDVVTALGEQLHTLSIDPDLEQPQHRRALEALGTRIVALDFGPLVERWRIEHARTLAAIGLSTEADAELQTVVGESETLGDDELRARALIGRVSIANLRGDADAPAIEREAEGAAARVGSPGLTASLDALRATRRLSSGDAAGAAKLLRAAIAAYEPVALDTDAMLFRLWENLGASYQETGDYAEAQQVLERQIQIAVRRWGGDAPETWLVRGRAAINRMYVDGSDGSELDRVNAVLSPHGPSGELARLDGEACQAALELRAATARQRCALALAVGEQTFGPDHAQIIWLLDGVGEERLRARDNAAALVVLRRAAKLVEHGSIAYFDPLETEGYLAIALARTGERRAGAVLAAKARAGFGTNAGLEQLQADLDAEFPRRVPR